MAGNLYYTTGQKITFYQEVLNSHQQLVDGYVPVVTRIISPILTMLPGYPQNMARLDIGLYVFQFIAPSTIGTYFVDIVYLDPSNNMLASDSRQVIISSPWGNFGLFSSI